MIYNGSLVHQAPLKRKFPIGATLVKDQLVVVDNATGGEIIDAGVNDQTEAVGVTLEAGDYSTVQGTGASSALVLVDTIFDPFQLIKAKCSGGVTADTDLAEATDGNLLSNDTASAGGLLLTDTAVGTSEFVGGRLYMTTGNNKGAYRTITAHTDNTSTAVTVPFDTALAASDLALRTFGVFQQGIELTTSLTQLNMKPGAGADLPDTGHLLIYEIEVDLSEFTNNTTPPTVHAIFGLVDHAFNSVA